MNKKLGQEECATISVPKAGKRLGIGRNAAYAAAKRGEIPTLRIGGLLRVPVVALERKLAEAGMEGAMPGGAA